MRIITTPLFFLLIVCCAGALVLDKIQSHDSLTNQLSTTVRPLVPSKTKPIPTENFNHEFQLDPDGNFWLFWNISGRNATFEAHVRTRGYIGFGLSPNGKMFPSDVVVGWVNSNGAIHFMDCHTIGHYTPVVDSSQDWHLLKGFENNFGTVLTFTRQLDTCDDNDTVITDSTMKAIYSYHPEDPDSIETMQWHGVNRRGAKSLMFLSSTKSDIQMPADILNIDLIAPNYHVPAVETRYQCTIYKVPPLSKKHHMIRYEPLVQKKNIDYVHHIVVTTCPDLTDADVGANFECYNNPDRRFQTCSSIVLAWAVGGLAYNLPDHVGYAFGSPGSPTYLRLEIHYNNPTFLSDIVDSSGIRMILTSQLRQHDAGSLSTGVSVRNTQFIPPYQKAFLSTGYCPSKCTEMGIPQTGIKIFGLFQHAHLLGAGIKTRHIRNGTELPPIAEDDHYDFDYQDIRALKEEREVKPGDSIVVECTYDSSRRNKPSFGGLSTHEEMCVSFLYYYPKIAMSTCLSIPVYEQISSDSQEAIRQFSGWNWKDNNVQHMFQELVNNSTHNIHCNGPDRNKWNQFISTVPEPTLPYRKPDRQCQ